MSIDSGFCVMGLECITVCALDESIDYRLSNYLVNEQSFGSDGHSLAFCFFFVS
jgi:hypothetical protein